MRDRAEGHALRRSDGGACWTDILHRLGTNYFTRRPKFIVLLLSLNFASDCFSPSPAA
jgi:hypothetical protein